MSSGIDRIEREPGDAPAWMDSGIVWAMAWYTLGATASVIGLALALQTALTGAPFPVHWHRNLLWFAWATLLLLPGFAWSALQAEQSVWIARVAPLAAARAALRAFWLSLGTTLLVTALPMSIIALLAPPPGGAAAAILFVNGVLLGTLALGFLVCGAWNGQLPAAWAVLGLVGLLLVPLALTPDAHWVAWQGAQGWRAVVLLVLVAAPALAAWLLRQSLHRGPVVPGGQQAARTALRTQVHSWTRRFTDRIRLIGGSTAGVAVIIASQSIPRQIIDGQPVGFLTPMGSEVTMAALLRIFALTFLSLFLLASPDLHWRYRLAPGGGNRARLGLRIVVTSYGVSCGYLLMICAVAAVVALQVSNDRQQLWNQVPGLLARYVPVATVELALATALAALLRGSAGTTGKAVAALVGLVLMWVVSLLVVYVINDNHLPIVMRRDWNYLLLVGTAAALCTWAATRVWARADLGDLMRSSRKRPAEGQ